MNERFSGKLVSVLLTALMLFSTVSSFADDKRAAESLIPIAVRLLGAGQIEDAGGVLAQAEQYDPDNDAVQYYKGMVLLAASSRMQGNAKEIYELLSAASLCLAKASAADSTNLWYKRRLGNLLFMLKKDNAAAELYSEILSASPFDIEILARLADIRINQGQYEKADSLISIVEKIEGENGITQLSRIEIYRQKGDYEAFFTAMRGFISEPVMGSAEKCEIINKFISSNDPRFNYYHLADYDALVQRCLEVYQGDTTVLKFAAGFYFSMQQYDRAIDLCGANPENASLAYMLMAAHIMQADYAAAIVDCDRLASMVGDKPALLSEIHCNKADCLQYSARTADAYREYEIALKFNPDNVVALNNYAYLMCCNGRKLSKCETMIRKVIESEPENPTYLDTYGWVLHMRKKDVEAKAVFKKALLYGGKDSADVLNHYAEVLESLGETSVAEAYRAQARLKNEK